MTAQAPRDAAPSRRWRRVTLHLPPFPGFVIIRPMLRAIGISLCLLVVGCAAPPKAQIRFDSDPPGAKVFVVYHPLADLENAKQTASYMGTTPFVGAVRVKGNGEIDPPDRVFIANDFVRPQVTFFAEPPKGVKGTNQFKTFMGGAMFHPGDRVPEAIMFEWKE